MDRAEYRRLVSAVDWSGLGPADPEGELPAALVAAVFEDEPAADEALGDVFGLVCHQDVLEPVAAVAHRVPHLVEAYVDGLSPDPTGVQAALAVVPSLALASRASVPWRERVQPWISRIAPADLAQTARELDEATAPTHS